MIHKRILINKIKVFSGINSNFLNLILILVGTLLLAISAKVQVPFWPVPMTMQTFVVFLIGMTYSVRLSLLTLIFYLFQGAIGLPVFAGTPEKGVGLIYFTGPTMGYLIGFLFAVFFSGFFKFDNNLFKNFLKLVFSVSFIYLFGLLWLGSIIGWEKPIFELGAQPFLLAELLTCMSLVPYQTT